MNPYTAYKNDKARYPQSEYALYLHYPCKIVRHELGFYCMYIRLPDDHPNLNREIEKFIRVDNNTFGYAFNHFGDFFDGGLYDASFPNLNAERIPNTLHYWTFEEVKTQLIKVDQEFYERRLLS